MSDLVLSKISKKFAGDVVAIENVSLSFPAGKMTALVGPSGCGKTTLLRIIAGLESPTSGDLLLDGSSIAATPAHIRKFGMVFQSFALFPHLNVEDNIAYSLSISGVKKTTRLQRAKELLKLVKLDGFGQRRIGQLSGGQRQRVAIARALAQNPSIFLLDEPMSALDAQLREEMQIELRMLQQELGITTIVVTHDQREAMTMADQIVVMNAGNVEQVGKPQEVYTHPANRFVASFIGKVNAFEGIVNNDTVKVGTTDLHIANPLSYLNGARVEVTCRPELTSITLESGSSHNGIGAEVSFIRDIGSVREVFLDADGTRVICEMQAGVLPDLEQGMKVIVQLPADALRVYPVDSAA
ncbi:MAG: ABC transporter ATP-binding protein [Granulosicoccus sp.]